MDCKRGDDVVRALELEELLVAGVVQDDRRLLRKSDPAAVLTVEADQERLPDVAVGTPGEVAGIPVELEDLRLGRRDELEHDGFPFVGFRLVCC